MRAGDRVGLRVVGADVDGGLMAVKMVKYTVKGRIRQGCVHLYLVYAAP